MTKISVILTAYNLENVITEAVNSLIGQNFPDYEIIITDDGSTDSTPEIIEKYAKKFEFIKPLFLKHAGAGNARNEGFKISSGKYVIFLDGDDIFHSDFLYLMHQKIEEENADIVICNSQEFQGSPKNVKKTHFNENYPIGWAWDKLIRRSLIESKNLKFSTLDSSNDLSFTYGAIFLSEKTAQIPDCLVYRRLREESISANRNEENAFLALLELKKILIENEKFEEKKDDFVNISLRLIFWLFNSAKTREKRKKVLEYIKKYEDSLGLMTPSKIKFKKCFDFYEIALKSKNNADFCVNYIIKKFLKI